MKKLVILAGLFLSCFVIQAQVGIGTIAPDASTVLDVSSTTNGVLLPRLTTAQRDLITTPASGLLIYNTTTKTFQYNFGTPGTSNWFSLNNAASVKYTNTDIVTDIAFNNIDVPIFGALAFNDDPLLYVRTSATEMIVVEAGRYKLTANIHLEAGDATNVIFHFLVNGVPQSTTGSFNEVNTRGNGSTIGFSVRGTVTMSEVVDLPANAIIKLNTSIFNGWNFYVANMASVGTSNFMIERIN